MASRDQRKGFIDLDDFLRSLGELIEAWAKKFLMAQKVSVLLKYGLVAMKDVAGWTSDSSVREREEAEGKFPIHVLAQIAIKPSRLGEAYALYFTE